MYHHFSVYILNGVQISISVETELKIQFLNPVNGSEIIYKELIYSATRRNKEVKILYDIPMNINKFQKTQPNHKVDRFFKHFGEVLMDTWFLGRNFFCDNHTQGFQVKYEDTRYITYNS